ncbi:hypothetical protein RhiLY_12138 [Ceratobasidium sp. AG-Ba]|nr:hypothetical protein RhiLY_12138 [Ceratobasidium sp. AG-Ba]
MVKHIASPTCPYCGWPGKNFSAVERHVRQRPICAAEQSKERNKLLGSKAHPALHRDQANSNRGLALPTESNVAGPSRQRSVSPSVSVEEVEDDDMPGKKSDPPRRNPNAILEDKRLDDEDIPETPPPRRNPSVVIEEVEDEDMPQAPRWGPHPYAKPTRASLFPEPYPDPTAGAAREFYDVDRNPPPAYTSILAEPDTFREAYWLDHLPICRDDEAEYFSLPRTHTWHWDSLKEFEQEIGRLPRGPPWFRETIIVNGDQENEILNLWKRDVIALIRYLLSDRRFIPHMRFAPERQYDSETRQNQIYSEMWSGKWWWRMQNILGRYATIVPIILSTDKSKMTVFSGNQKAWPVYLTIGNISHHICRCPSERATLLVGYIPVSNLSNISDETERSEAEWQLFHTCMESILEPLKTFSRTGFNVLCADGGVRRVFPILAAYIADHPEQVMIACVRDSGCPICWVPFNQRGDLTVRYARQDRRRTLDALDDHWNGYSQTVKILGIHPTRPFWADLPHVDISTCIAPDLLHQLDKGVFGHHLLKWTTALLGSNTMDRRTKGMPRFQNLRHFARGILVISQWTGKESKSLARTFLTIVAGYEDARLVKATRSIVDFMACAHKHEVAESDLAAMQRDLVALELSKGVFVNPGKRDLLRHERRFNKIPKLHSLTHYPYLISQLGAPEGLSTEITERLHIDFVKEPWLATNHVNPIQQMVGYLENREAWALLRAYMHDQRLVIDPRFKDTVKEDDDEDAGVEEGLADAADGGEDGVLWQPAPTVWMAKRPSLRASVKGTYLIQNHQARDFIRATTDYLRLLHPTRTAFPISHDTAFQVWRRCKLRHRRLPFDPVLDPQTDQVRAFTTSTDSEGRVLRAGHFDVVLFSPQTSNTRLQGLHKLEAGRVRVIFALPPRHQSLSSEKLAYIERFTPFSARPSALSSLYTTQHASQRGHRSAIVVPLSQLRMTCHLAPRYHLLDPNFPVSSTTDLLSAHNTFYLNKYASPWLFSVLDYWEKQRH